MMVVTVQYIMEQEPNTAKNTEYISSFRLQKAVPNGQNEINEKTL